MSEYITKSELEKILEFMNEFQTPVVELHFGDQSGIGRNLEISFNHKFPDLSYSNKRDVLIGRVFFDITSHEDW